MTRASQNLARARTADEWFARRRLGLVKGKEQAEFEAWLADGQNEAAYRDLEEMSDDLGAVAATAEVRQMRAAALALAPARRPPARTVWPIAASLLIALAAAGAWTLTTIGEGEPMAPTGAEAVQAPAVKRYVTKVGERLNVRLEDGSLVTLNTNSVMEVAFTPRRRDVRLLQGQGMFQVAKNAERPFVVAAGDRRVTAVGTAFDVRIDAGKVRVVLAQGHVVVDPIRPDGLARVLPALERVDLRPGEQLSKDVAGPATVSVADVDRALSWREGQVVFRDDDLAAAIKEMNRYSSTQILIEDPGVADLKISGVFGVSRPENFIAAVTAFYPLEARRRSEGAIVLAWRTGG